MAMGEGEGEGSLRSPEKLKLLYIIKGLTAPGRAGVNYDITSPHGPQETFSKIYIFASLLWCRVCFTLGFYGTHVDTGLKEECHMVQVDAGYPLNNPS